MNAHITKLLASMAALGLALSSANALAATVPLAAWDYIGFDGTVNYNGGNQNQAWGVFLGHQDDAFPPGGNIESRGVLEFNLAGMSNGPVQSAVFSFPATDVMNYGVSSCFNYLGCPKLPAFDVFGYVGDGLVPTNSSPATVADFAPAGATFIQHVVTPDFGQTISIDITTFLNGLLGTNNDFLGLLLRPATGVDGQGALASGPLTIGQGGNVIVIQEGGRVPIPEPTTLALLGLGLGLAGLAAARCRKPT